MGNMNTAMAGLGIGTSIASGISSYKTASAQYKVDEANRATNNKLAEEALMTSYSLLDKEEAQLRQDAIGNSIDIQRASAVAKGKAKAEAGASGTGGTGVDMQEQDVNTEAGRNHARNEMNRDRALTQIDTQRQSAANAYSSRINLMPSQAPSAIAYGLQAGYSGFRNVTALQDMGRSMDSMWGADDTIK